jgi:hypothetical protein
VSLTGLIATGLGRHVNKAINPVVKVLAVVALLWAFKMPKRVRTAVFAQTGH